MLSAIRIADAFSFRAHPNLTLEEQGISMQVLLMIKMRPEDQSEHSLLLELIEPNGELSTVGDFKGAKSESKVPGLPGGLNLVAKVQVIPDQMGLHYWRVVLNGEVIAKAPFSLIGKQDPA